MYRQSQIRDIFSVLPEQTVYIVDDDESVLDSLSLFLTAVGLKAKCYLSALEFIAEYEPGMTGCLLLDIEMPAVSGLELQNKLSAVGASLPIIFITGHANVPNAVLAMKNGAFDFIEKPFDNIQLVKCIHKALSQNFGKSQNYELKTAIVTRLNSLTAREAEVLPFLLSGKSAKFIARKMNLSPRTVEIYRANILLKMQTKTVVQLAGMLHENSITLKPLQD